MVNGGSYTLNQNETLEEQHFAYAQNPASIQINPGRGGCTCVYSGSDADGLGGFAEKIAFANGVTLTLR